MEESPESGQAGASEGEIEITPEMVEVGERVLCGQFGHDRFKGLDRECVTRIFQAMHDRLKLCEF